MDRDSEPPGIMVERERLPLLEAGIFRTRFPGRLAGTASPDWLVALLDPAVSAPVSADEALRGAVRALLRAGGFKPSGRSKPASEYLVRAARDGALAPINLAVDACNAASLHGGLPISVVDLARARPPFRVAVAPEGARYVFNASGQEIDIEGLLCLHDTQGPCAGPVKDSQRTKTGPETVETLSVVWGTLADGAPAGHTARVVAWYRSLLERAGAATADVPAA